jgi:dTDP-4-dehydrorhamnose reductase
VASKLVELLEAGLYGTYHLTNGGRASRYDYVKCIVEAFGLSSGVEGVDSSRFPRRAAVPNCESLANLNLHFAGLKPLAPWEDAVRRYVARLKQGLRDEVAA